MHPQIIALFPGLCMGLGTRLPTNHSIEMRMPMWSVTSYPDSFSWRKEGAWVQSYSGLNMSLYTQTTALFPDPLKFPHNLVMGKDWEWGYLASNLGFPFWILSRSFGEKYDFSPKLWDKIQNGKPGFEARGYPDQYSIFLFIYPLQSSQHSSLKLLWFMWGAVWEMQVFTEFWWLRFMLKLMKHSPCVTIHQFS